MRGALLMTLLGVALLGGCASDIGPSPAELKAQWEAQNVYPQTYKNDLLAFLRTYLNDPTHVRGAVLSQPVLKDGRPGSALCRLPALQCARQWKASTWG